jgi:hypothetical protein
MIPKVHLRQPLKCEEHTIYLPTHHHLLPHIAALSSRILFNIFINSTNRTRTDTAKLSTQWLSQVFLHPFKNPISTRNIQELVLSTRNIYAASLNTYQLRNVDPVREIAGFSTKICEFKDEENTPSKQILLNSLDLRHLLVTPSHTACQSNETYFLDLSQ